MDGAPVRCEERELLGGSFRKTLVLGSGRYHFTGTDNGDPVSPSVLHRLQGNA